jgi:hypothetical protein
VHQASLRLGSTTGVAFNRGAPLFNGALETTLIAAGRSNRQIAQALFISPKTASVHVSNILAKLGAAGRVEAAAIAHRLGLD